MVDNYCYTYCIIACLFFDFVITVLLDHKDKVEPIQSEAADSCNIVTTTSLPLDDVRDNDQTKYDISQLQRTRCVVFSQIMKATRQLEEEPSVLNSTQLCTLITTAANTLKTLKDCDKTL